MKPNAYKDVMTERWVADICAYPACGKGPRKPYNAEQPIVSGDEDGTVMLWF